MSSKSKQPGVSREYGYFTYMADADIMNCLLKQKSRSYAYNKGSYDFLLGKSTTDCPYGEGIYREAWFCGYENEQEGLPF